MALIIGKTFPELAGIELTYWRLLSLRMNAVTRGADVILGGWLNQTVYEDQETKIPTKEVHLTLNPDEYNSVFSEDFQAVQNFSNTIAGWIVTQDGWEDAQIV